MSHSKQQRIFPVINRTDTNNNEISSAMGRDDSWPATEPSVVPTGDCSHWYIHYIH